MLDFQGATIGADPSLPEPQRHLHGDRWTRPVPSASTCSPRAACSDGVDNDRDGRVDLDDPDCQNDPRGTTE